MPSKPRKFNTALFFEVVTNVIRLWNSFYDFSINFAQTYRLNIEIDWSPQIWCGLFSDNNGLGSTVPTGEYRERSTPAGPALNLALGEPWAALFLRRWRIRPDVLWSPADLSLSLIWDGGVRPKWIFKRNRLFWLNKQQAVNLFFSPRVGEFWQTRAAAGSKSTNSSMAQRQSGHANKGIRCLPLRTVPIPRSKCWPRLMF